MMTDGKGIATGHEQDNCLGGTRPPERVAQNNALARLIGIVLEAADPPYFSDGTLPLVD